MIAKHPSNVNTKFKNKYVISRFLVLSRLFYANSHLLFIKFRRFQTRKTGQRKNFLKNP